MIMKQKKDYEKYKPENARQSKWDGLNESEEEIMKKLMKYQKNRGSEFLNTGKYDETNSKCEGNG